MRTFHRTHVEVFLEVWVLAQGHKRLDIGSLRPSVKAPTEKT